MKWWTAAWAGVRRAPRLYIPALYAGFFPLIFGAMGRPAEMALAAATGLLLLAVLNLEKFESFAGAGFKATVRKVVNDAHAVVDDAHATIERLHDVAAALAEPIVMSIAMQGRMQGTFSVEERFNAIADIETKLKRVGVSSGQIENATSYFFRLVESDHVHIIGYLLGQQPNVPPSLKERALELKRADNPDYDVHGLFQAAGWTPDGLVADWVQDLDYFREGRKLRRPDAFRKALPWAT